MNQCIYCEEHLNRSWEKIEQMHEQPQEIKKSVILTTRILNHSNFFLQTGIGPAIKKDRKKIAQLFQRVSYSLRQCINFNSFHIYVMLIHEKPGVFEL